MNSKAVRIEEAHLSVVQGRETLPDVVTGWQCLKGIRRSVVMLSYSCADDDGTGCDGHREWLRVLGTDGASLDPDLKREDPRQNALFDQLGIGSQMDKGVQMQSVINTK